MKRLMLLLVVTILGAGLAVAQNEGVSLGDAARMQRQKKSQPSPNAKVYDNENLPKSGALSTTSGDFGGAAATTSSSTSASASGSSGNAAAGRNAKGGDDADKEQADEFRQKVGDVKKNIDSLTRELDLMQREQRLRAAAYYGDAGMKARPENQARYQADEKKYQDDLKSKTDDLNTAKQALDDLRDQIRKAGLPSTIGE